MRPKTINEVLRELDRIVNLSISRDDQAGLFAYIYWRTTDQIRRAIALHQFEDGARMERFDVAFANLYLDAYHAHRNGNPVRKVWQTAFDAARQHKTILQHILLGMNAHINFDLAIAASQVSRLQPIDLLRADYEKVNDILASLVDELQERISRVSPLFFLVDWLGRDSDEALINFSMAKARTHSWILANELWALPESQLEGRLQQADAETLRLARLILNPPGPALRYGLHLVQAFEPRSTTEILVALRQR